MKKNGSYTATYEPNALLGEQGYDWFLYANGRLVAEGWSRGKKSNAEDDVRQTISNRDALRSAVQIA